MSNYRYYVVGDCDMWCIAAAAPSLEANAERIHRLAFRRDAGQKTPKGSGPDTGIIRGLQKLSGLHHRYLRI